MFLINTKGEYYIYSLRWKDQNPDRHYTKLRSGVNEAIKKGLNQSNLLAVVANGNTISVFANSVYLDSVQDSSFTSGEIDIWGGNENASGTDLVAADARAWRL
ncbi:MAG: hypothetical protein IMW89_21270 [Ktedonobacteraceae bacterium]|nr:hypothetical protein [Ktedonobacteraceae bacterium]